MKILNVGCGGRPADRGFLAEVCVKVDIIRFPTVTIQADAHFLPGKKVKADE